MIDLVTRGAEVLILRDNESLSCYKKSELISEDLFGIIEELNYESKNMGQEILMPTEEDELFDLVDYLKSLSDIK
jgi:hypothetical protein